jgi:acyl-CoA thioesterase YciA
MAKDIGIHGNLFGGIMMSWIDEAAATYASEYCKTSSLVTVKMGEMVFKKAVKAGNHIRIYGNVSRLGNSSITLNVEARRYNVISSEEIVVCSTNITFVRIDEEGNPIRIEAPRINEKRKKYIEDVILTC